MADNTSSAAIDALMLAANVAGMQLAILVRPGTDVQTQDAGLQSISGLTTLADRMIFTTASDTYAVTVLTAFARTLLDDADAATARGTLDVDQAGTVNPPEGTAVLSTGEVGGTKFLREDGDNSSSWQPVPQGDALKSDPLSQFAATTSLELFGVISNPTGTGLAVFGTSPTLVTPALGTPTALVLTNATGLPTAGILDDAVTFAKIQNISATDRLLGRSTAGAGIIEEIILTAAGRALLDDASASAQRTTLGVGTGDSPQFLAVNLGAATDTTLDRAEAGVGQIEGKRLAMLPTAQEWTAQQNFNEVSLSDGANISWNLNTQQVATVTLAGNRTLDNPTNMKAGTTTILRVIQDGTGTRTLAFGTAYKWPGGTAPTLSTTAADVDILYFTSDGTSMFGTFAQDYS